MYENNIVFICDNNYVMPTEVAICSLIDNIDISLSILNIHIICFDLTEDNIDRLLVYNNESNVNVYIYDQKNNIEYTQKLSKITCKSHVTHTALLKFEIPNILPENIEKALYIDSDVVIKNNLLDIFDYSLDTQIIGGCFDFWKYQMHIYEYGKEVLFPDFYFNSGVLLINIELWKKNNVSEKLWEKKISDVYCENSKSFLMDQDAFNQVLKNYCFELPFKYNCNPRFIKNSFVPLINKVYGTNYKFKDDILEDAIIIHYVGHEDKPWIYYNSKCAKIWEYYYCMTFGESFKQKRLNNNANIFKLGVRLINRIREYGIKKTFCYLIDRLYY